MKLYLNSKTAMIQIQMIQFHTEICTVQVEYSDFLNCLSSFQKKMKQIVLISMFMVFAFAVMTQATNCNEFQFYCRFLVKNLQLFFVFVLDCSNGSFYPEHEGHKDFKVYGQCDEAKCSRYCNNFSGCIGGTSRCTSISGKITCECSRP